MFLVGQDVQKLENKISHSSQGCIYVEMSDPSNVFWSVKVGKGVNERCNLYTSASGGKVEVVKYVKINTLGNSDDTERFTEEVNE